MRSLYKRKIALAILLCLLLLGLTIPIGIHQGLFDFLSAHSDLDLASYVNPFIGTEPAQASLTHGASFDNGNVFPGASYPHGMVQWSPDTTNAAGGYRYQQSTIHGFSLTHFSGRGCGAYQDVPFIPILGPVTTSPAHAGVYTATFSHSQERATPGYYQVRLNNAISIALTVTPRSGFGQITYPSGKLASLLVNVGGSATSNSERGTGVQITGDTQVVGSASSGHFCGQANTYTVYFAALFDHPFRTFGTWNGVSVTPGSRVQHGKEAGAYLSFETTSSPVVQVKVGLSFVSIANAQANMAAENPGWDFEIVRQQARAAWNAHLNVIQLTGGTLAERQIFYTALYHSLIHPNVFSDVNGQYLGFDKQIHIAQGYTQYENFPGWDMYRSLIDLLALLEPHETSDMVQSLVADAQQGGGGLPRWEVANDNSGGMVGDSMDVVIATSYAFGARNFDTGAALQAMEEGASYVGTHSGRYAVREGLSDYLNLGYVSTQGNPGGSASITLEYAIDDFALAQFARMLGKMDDYQTYLERAHNWQHLFNRSTGYIEPRNADGSFIDHFNPMITKSFVEGDSSQYSWLVPQDLNGLFAAMGGNAKVVNRLDTFFTQLNGGSNRPYAAMGNEPSFEVPWEYDAAGAAYRTQEVVRRIETQLFGAGPAGLPGNDDGGAMSSWYVFAAMGIYPELPGVAGFMLGSPLFPKIEVHMGNGHILQIIGNGASETAPYVQSLRLNKQDYNSTWIPFSALMNGSTLQFTVGSSPNKASA
jgi:predicted alpha-1,2-mannosidase